VEVVGVEVPAARWRHSRQGFGLSDVDGRERIKGEGRVTEDEMTLGRRVRVVQEIESYPEGIIPAGTTGTVSDINPPDQLGFVLRHVLLDQYFPAFEDWDNRLQVYPGVIAAWGPENFEAIDDE
jgi:hypothetical protein